MNYLGKNLKWLRKQGGLTQADLATHIGVKRSLIGAYEEGRAEPRLLTIRSICQYFNVSLDDLVNQEMSNESAGSVSDYRGEQLRLLPLVVDETDEKELATIVPVKAAAGYLNGYGDIGYIESLPRFRMPFPELPEDRTYRLFQIRGDSMLPVPPGAYVVSEYVQDWGTLKNDDCYVVITKVEGVVYKRIENKISESGELLLKSDNPEYDPYTVRIDQVLEVWKALGYTTFELPHHRPASMGFDRLSEVVVELKREIDTLKQQKPS